MILLITVALLSCFSSVAGVTMTDVPRMRRNVIPLAGGVLMGLALFWVLPDLAERCGWPLSVVSMVIGASLLWAVNRWLYPICPTCSHSHDHTYCDNRLHGFAAPLLLAAGIHSFFDGWSLTLSLGHDLGDLGRALSLGIALHKVPQGIVLGIILRSALRSRRVAVLSALLINVALLFGGLTQSHYAAALDSSPVIIAFWRSPQGAFSFWALTAFTGSERSEASPRLQNRR